MLPSAIANGVSIGDDLRAAYAASIGDDYNGSIATAGDAGAKNKRSKPRLLLAASIQGPLLLPFNAEGACHPGILVSSLKTVNRV